MIHYKTSTNKEQKKLNDYTEVSRQLEERFGQKITPENIEKLKEWGIVE